MDSAQLHWIKLRCCLYAVAVKCSIKTADRRAKESKSFPCNFLELLRFIPTWVHNFTRTRVFVKVPSRKLRIPSYFHVSLTNIYSSRVVKRTREVRFFLGNLMETLSNTNHHSQAKGWCKRDQLLVLDLLFTKSSSTDYPLHRELAVKERLFITKL